MESRSRVSLDMLISLGFWRRFGEVRPSSLLRVESILDRWNDRLCGSSTEALGLIREMLCSDYEVGEPSWRLRKLSTFSARPRNWELLSWICSKDCWVGASKGSSWWAHGGIKVQMGHLPILTQIYLI